MKITDWFKKKQKQKDKPKVVWLEEADSTNDEIRKLADEQTQRMVVVVTDISERDAVRRQTDGRVRLERTCFSV